MSSRYEIIINWSEDDECFVAEVPELPGCMADGPTYQEAVTHAESAIEDWIEAANQLGRTVPKAKGRKLMA
jgi:predicted RNase H-like HicB family nuclease